MIQGMENHEEYCANRSSEKEVVTEVDVETILLRNGCEKEA